MRDSRLRARWRARPQTINMGTSQVQFPVQQNFTSDLAHSCHPRSRCENTGISTVPESYRTLNSRQRCRRCRVVLLSPVQLRSTAVSVPVRYCSAKYGTAVLVRYRYRGTVLPGTTSMYVRYGTVPVPVPVLNLVVVPYSRTRYRSLKVCCTLALESATSPAPGWTTAYRQLKMLPTPPAWLVQLQTCRHTGG
eukprot:SAG22_NODE_4474_length_1258_cov_1.145815_2_plen_193_part_00